MSVVKSKRKQSRVEFEQIYFKVADSIDNLVEHNFYVKDISKHKIFLEIRNKSLEKLTDKLLYDIKIANSIYPTCNLELQERRLYMDKAIGICFAILTHFQRIMKRLDIYEDKYTNDILNIINMINSLKSWRKSDNRFKDSFSD